MTRIVQPCPCGNEMRLELEDGEQDYMCDYCGNIFRRVYNPRLDTYELVDILCIDDTHKKKAEIIKCNLDLFCKPINTILIGGKAGTGKTEVAEVLRHLIDAPCTVLHLDNFYAVEPSRRNQVRKLMLYTNVGKNEIDWLKLEDAVTEGLGKYKFIIIEGLYSLFFNKNLILPYGVFLEGEQKDTYEFRKMRGKEDPDAKERKIVLDRESRSVAQSRKFADLIIPYNL